MKSANNGYAHAQSVLGYLYYWGDPIIGKTKDYNSALKWFLMSAEQNDISALYYLGEMYNDGTGVSRDLNKSLEYHYRAAQNGHDVSQQKSDMHISQEMVLNKTTMMRYIGLIFLPIRTMLLLNII